MWGEGGEWAGWPYCSVERGEFPMASCLLLVLVQAGEPLMEQLATLLLALAVRASGMGQQLPASTPAHWAEVMDAWAQAARGAPGSQQEQRWLLQLEEALATRPCASLGCTHMAGSSEADLKGRRCAGCATVRYCSAQCAGRDWPRHKPACKLLAAARAAGGGG